MTEIHFQDTIVVLYLLANVTVDPASHARDTGEDGRRTTDLQKRCRLMKWNNIMPLEFLKE